MEEVHFIKLVKVRLEIEDKSIEEKKEEFYKKYPKNLFTARTLGIRNELASVSM